MTAPMRFRPAWAEVDLEALRHNVRVLRDVAPTAALCAVVKADGYGHGAVPVARAAVEAGAACLAVALVEEGIVLREAGIEAPVLLLSEPPPSAAPSVVAHGLTPTLYTAEGIDAFGVAAEGRSGGPLGVQLKVDTGMHRVGADPAAAVDLARRIHDDPRLHLDAVWTHFAVADDATKADVTEAQLRRFADACAAIETAGVSIPSRHAANAAGTLLVGAHLDVVRPGIAVYGYDPDPSRPHGDLRPVLSLKAEVSHVKVLEAGERLSYGLRYELAARSTIATVPLGYADGVPRRLSETGGVVLVGGRRCPIAGTVTMDQILVDCGSLPVERGDEVVLLGAQGDDRISADDWAERLGTISYEILCGIGARVPRVHIGVTP